MIALVVASMILGLSAALEAHRRRPVRAIA
jgi:hypothetical protein